MDEDKSLAKKRNILEHELKNVKTPTDKKDSNSKLLDENIKPLTSQQLHKAPKLNMSTDKKGKIFKQSKNAALKNVKNAEGEGDSRHSSSLSQFSWKSDSELYNKNIKIAQRKKNESKSGHFSSHAILKKSKSSGSHFSSHAILKKSKSSGSHFSSHAILKKSNSGARFKSPRESNSGELRQNFIARKRSSSLVRLRPPKSYEYIRRVMKGMSVSDPSFGSLKKKQINSTLSIYRGETNRSHYGVPSQEIRRSEVLGGDHHGWPLNVKQHIAYVNPIKQNSIKPHQLNTKTHHKTAEKEHDFDLARNSDVAVESKPIIFLKKPDQETLLSSKFDVSVSDLEVSLSYESKPLVIADLISKFMESYGSEMGLFQTCPDLFKINELDGVFIETVINPIKPKGRKKTRKHKVKKVKESKVREVKKMPSKPFKIACSLCNLVRRRQSELRPYMQRMQKQRQRLELRTYYIQNLLKCRRDQQQDVQERKRTSAREVLTRCYQTLNLCQQILEQRQLNKCQPQ
ncbi:uncharacterized protein LOC108042381 [Drosophila rhopaloa]|uniref:Uncharacterized protein LOC108042381 n=1 Tax=Drosophila rhopaloa TaxID=1041015 RepID=A0A6P4ED61_DRORH|nr:uncharacterized protein LOC108042381 [Drosophila rhopaloa]